MTRSLFRSSVALACLLIFDVGMVKLTIPYESIAGCLAQLLVINGLWAYLTYEWIFGEKP